MSLRPYRAHRLRRSRAESACGRRSRRHRRRCACSTAATGTGGQIAVRVVDLDHLEAGLDRALGGVRPVPGRAVRVRRASSKLARHDVARRHRLGGGGRRVGQVFSPRAKSSAVSAPLPYQGRCMEPLRPACASWIAGHHALRLHEVGDALQRRDVRRRPDADVAVGDAALVGHRRRLDEHAAGAAEREPARDGRSASPGRCRRPPNRWPSAR